MSILQRRVLGVRLRAWILLTLFLPVLLWGILNLFFSTPWGTRIFEDKAKTRLGLECEIESVTWSPWAGVVIEKVEIQPPVESGQETAMVSIGRVQIDPSWSSLFDGKKRWERLEIQNLEADVSIEMVHAILSRYEKRRPGAVVVADQGEGAVELAPNKEPKRGDEFGNQPAKQDGKEPPRIAKQEKKPVKRSEKPSGNGLEESVPVDPFEGVVVFSGTRLRLYSEREPEISMTLDDVQGEIPVWGAAREGEVVLGLVQLGERFEERALKIPVKWEKQSFGVTNHAFKLFGLNFKLNAEFQIRTGLPFGLQVEVPTQQADLSSVFLNRDSPIAVTSLSSRNLLQGYLKFPSSFQGQSMTRFENLVFSDLTDGGQTRFHRGYSKVRLSAAGFVAEDVRMIGDDDAILMNGFATTGGDMAATVRVVASPERAQSHEKRVRQAGANLTLDFQDLITPDREFRDIRIEAQDGVLMMDLGSDRSWVPFIPAAKAIVGRENIELPKLP